MHSCVSDVVFQVDIPVSIQPEQPSVNANSPFDEGNASLWLIATTRRSFRYSISDLSVHSSHLTREYAWSLHDHFYSNLLAIETPENADLSELMNCSTNLELELPPNPVQQEAKREFAMDASDDMEDVLTCVCCQDIMTNPVTLEPCLHAFCSDCYASWEAVQRTW